MAKTPAAPAVKRTRAATAQLPTSLPTELTDFWPGGSRGGSSKNAALRAQIVEDFADMALGSIRRYDGALTEAERTAFGNMARAACKQVHGNTYGVRIAYTEDAAFIRLGNPRTRTAK